MIHETETGDILPSYLIPDDSRETNNLSVNSDGDYEYVIVLHMDIWGPLYTLWSLLEEKVGGTFVNFSFSLKDCEPLAEHLNLCLQHEGHVEINVQFKIGPAITPQQEDDIKNESELLRKGVLHKINYQQKVQAMKSGRNHLLVTAKQDMDSDQLLKEGCQGEFKLINPELVATLWGQRKNKSNMNYQKLSLSWALRYYYNSEMISQRVSKHKMCCPVPQSQLHWNTSIFAPQARVGKLLMAYQSEEGKKRIMDQYGRGTVPINGGH